MELSNDGYWDVKLKLAPGSYEYKYVVDGKMWIEDPNVPDPYGGRNSVVTIKRENGVLKYFDNAIDKYISYNIDTGNIDLSLFYGNDVFPINGLDEDFSISHSSDNYIGLYTNMSF